VHRSPLPSKDLLADGALKLAFGLSGDVQINYVIPTRADHAKR
jgi:hypothetical protein